MKDLCITCGIETLLTTLKRNAGICEKCKNDKRTIDELSKNITSAIYSNNYDVVYRFLSRDIKYLDFLIDNCWHPIHYASYFGKNNSLRAIINHGENIEKDVFGNNKTPLYIAVENNHYECAELLLKYKANPNVAENDYLSSPLHIAARYGFAEISQLLINNNANRHAVDHENNTPLQIAIENNRNDLIQILK